MEIIFITIPVTLVFIAVAASIFFGPAKKASSTTLIALLIEYYSTTTKGQAIKNPTRKKATIKKTAQKAKLINLAHE